MTPDEIIEVMQGFKSGRGWQFLSTASEWKTPILSSLDSMLHALYSGQTIRLAPLPDEITIPARVIPAPLREEQAENARLRAHIQDAAKKANAAFLARDTVANKRLALNLHKWHLAALGETN